MVWDLQTVTAHLGWERLTAGTPHRAECCTRSSSTIRKWNYLSRARKRAQSTAGGLDNSFCLRQRIGGEKKQLLHLQL